MTDLDDQMLRDAPRADSTTLENIRDRIRELRDLELEKASLKERIDTINARMLVLTQKELVELFDGASVATLGVKAEGNLPPFEVEIKPYYHANIASDWESEKKAKAFGWLKSKGHGDLIKGTYTVAFGMGTEKKQKEFVAALKKLKIEYSYEFGVPWNTLTAFVREQIEHHKKTPPLELLGAKVGRVAAVKKQKGKK